MVNFMCAQELNHIHFNSLFRSMEAEWLKCIIILQLSSCVMEKFWSTFLFRQGTDLFIFTDSIYCDLAFVADIKKYLNSRTKTYWQHLEAHSF